VEELRTLVLAARAGDLESYGEIVRRFQDLAYGYAYSLLGDLHLAEDAAQQAFVQAYRDLAKLREPEAFPGWLRRIVFTQCNRLTRGKQISAGPLESALDVASTEPGPPENAARRELREAVLAALRSLPDNERTVTTLFYINGYSQNDIAEFLEVPVTTVNGRLRTSRDRLRERMIEMVEEELRRSATDERFAQHVIKELIARPRPLEIEGHPLRQIWETIRAELPDYEVIETEEIVRKDVLPPLVRNDVERGVFDRIAYRPSDETLLRTSMPLSTLAAIQGRRPPVRILTAGRVFNAQGWPTPTGKINVAHVCDVLCIEEGFDREAFRSGIERVIHAVLGSVEIDFEWGSDDAHPSKPPIHRAGTFSVQHRGEWYGVCRGGLLTQEILEQCGYEPDSVGGGHFGFGLERLAIPKLGIDGPHVLWQPPYTTDFASNT